MLFILLLFLNGEDVSEWFIMGVLLGLILVDRCIS